MLIYKVLCLLIFIFSILTAHKTYAQMLTPQSFSEVLRIFERHAATIDPIRKGHMDVPRIYFASLPKDIRTSRDLSQRQQLFILSILPIILKTNEMIRKDRQYLIQLAKNPFQDADADQEKLQKLAQKYNLKTTDPVQMLKHVDIIPPSLALAQASLETGWGQSKAAVFKNSLYGMTINDTVQRYRTLEQATWAYMRNLNYNPAYQSFRALRAKMRLANKPLNSLQLAKTLKHYNKVKRAYLKVVERILITHNLSDFDRVKLVKASEIKFQEVSQPYLSPPPISRKRPWLEIKQPTIQLPQENLTISDLPQLTLF